jgi:phenylalanyl-tRNA synthetase alpha chain
MLERLQELHGEAAAKIEEANTLDELQQVRVAYLGKKGPITEVMKSMGSCLKKSGR